VRAAAHALPLEVAAGRGRVAARGLAAHDAAQRLLDRRDELVPPVGWGCCGAPPPVVVVALRIVVPVGLTLIVVVRGDEEHVADAAAERGDLGAARAQAERGERAGDVRDEARSILAAQRRAHDESSLAVLCRLHRQLVGGRRNCCCCDAEVCTRSDASSTAAVCRFSSLTCSITSASSDALSVCTKHKNGFRAMASSLLAA
jgi:hypothetical protein